MILTAEQLQNLREYIGVSPTPDGVGILRVADLLDTIDALREQIAHEQEQRKGNFEAWESACGTIRNQLKENADLKAQIAGARLEEHDTMCEICGCVRMKKDRCPRGQDLEKQGEGKG